MDLPITVDDLLALVAPVFEDMLKDEERKSLRIQVESYESGKALGPEEIVIDDHTHLRWEVLGETGNSGGIRLSDGVTSVLRFIADDLQDFIAESDFAWAELRPSRYL